MIQNIKKIERLVKLFENRCRYWSSIYNKEQDKDEIHEYIFNESLKTIHKYSDIKYILVGDNPGIEEKKQRKYFEGHAGVIARLFFEHFLVKDFDSQVITLNKSAIYTNVTKYLKSGVSQKFMACLLYNFHKCLPGIPIIICGYSGGLETVKSELKQYSKDSANKNATTNIFFHTLVDVFQNEVNITDKIIITKHFSRGCFFEDFRLSDYNSDDVMSSIKKYSKTHIFFRKYLD